jgi:enoyl-CoA hydratase
MLHGPDVRLCVQDDEADRHMEQLETVAYEAIDGTAWVTLNRPESLNAFNARMQDELQLIWRSLREDDAVRCAVLTGAGEKAFCAGADLGRFAEDAPLVAKHYSSDRFLELFRLIPRLGKPSLCAANGHVLAGGMGLALSCDLVIANERATFGLPEINVGAFPYMVMSIIYRQVPRKVVNEMVLLGERISAEQAVEYGLANKAVPESEFGDAIAEWSRKLASKSMASRT